MSHDVIQIAPGIKYRTPRRQRDHDALIHRATSAQRNAAGHPAAFRLNAPVLSDDVIRLEPLGEEHLAGLAALGQDPEVAQNTRVPEPWPDGFERTWLELYDQGRRDGTRDGYAVVDAATGAFLGIAGVVDIHPDANQGEIGYALAPEARGRGIATRALRLVTRYALDDLGLERLELQIAAGNDASIRVAEKCGYSREGVLRSLYVKPGRRGDFVIYSRLPGD